MEKKIKPLMYIVIVLLSALSVFFLFSSVSPLYWYVYEDKDAWCYLYGLIGIRGGALYSDYIEAVGPLFDIYNKTVTAMGGRSVYFVIDILTMSLTVIQSIKLVIEKRGLSKYIMSSILIFIVLYVSVANQVGMVDRVFGISAGMMMVGVLEGSLSVKKKRRLFIFGAGVIYSMALFYRFNLLLLLVPVFIIVRKKINAVYFLCGAISFSVIGIGVIMLGSYKIRDLFCWWIKAGILDYRSLIGGLYIAGIYLYIYFIEANKNLYVTSDMIVHKRFFNRFMSCSILMISFVILNLLMILKVADRNLTYVASGYEYDRYSAYRQLLETVPESERCDIMGFANTVGFFIANDITPADRPVVVRDDLYRYDASLWKKHQKDIVEFGYLRVICNVSQGMEEKSQRQLLRKYYDVESAVSGFQMWKRR